MGTFFVEIKLGANTKIRALVDTGATFSKFPASVLKKLRVKPEFTTKVKLGDERILKRKVGSVKMTIAGKSATVPVMFGRQNETPLVGATTLEILGLAPDPVNKRLVEALHLEI